MESEIIVAIITAVGAVLAAVLPKIFDKKKSSKEPEDSKNSSLDNNMVQKTKKTDSALSDNALGQIKDGESGVEVKNEKNTDKTSSEDPQGELIMKLYHSRKFATTHEVIKEMSKYSLWSDEQIDRICEAAIYNDQVENILCDPDLQDFYNNLLNNTTLNTKNVIKVKRKVKDRAKNTDFQYRC